MQHIWTILCQFASEDKNSNALSLINVIDRIQITADPDKDALDGIILPINFHLVSMWRCEKTEERDEAKAQVKLYSPDMDDLGDINFSIGATNSVFARLNTKINGFPYKGDGLYVYKVFHVQEEKPVEVQHIPVNVELIPYLDKDGQ